MIKKVKKYINHVIELIYDPAIDVGDRSFTLFSVLVLIALFLAIPCGLIMHEPPMATISTLVGACFFTGYVIYTIRHGSIKRAKVILSVILVFIFLPAMFFTNGGAVGGTPIWLLLGTVYIALILEGKLKVVMMLCNIVVTILCWIAGYLYPETVTEYSRGGNYFDTIAAIFIVGAIAYSLFTFQRSLYRKEEEQKSIERLFEQTAMALVNAIDAKDRYTHGHSARVAEYSKKIGLMSGMSEREAEELYYVALLHDVGKIGIPEAIINKEGKLTKEEYEVIKQHPVFGEQILHSISEYPNLSIGAHYHHERYDGKGYPERLKGEDIPEFARIISVADAYDAMTSKRSYREAIPQQTVREEIVKGAGTQFDPEYAKIMQVLIDMDTEYEMKERGAVKELAGKTDLVCDEFAEDVSDGIHITPFMTRIRFKSTILEKGEGEPLPALILFDSLDGRMHRSDRENKELNYFEYVELWADGRYTTEGARKVRVEKAASPHAAGRDKTKKYKVYEIEALKQRDHVQIRIDDQEKLITIIVALPDSSRFAYISLTGKNCQLYDVSIEKDETETPPDSIPRIAEEVSYINGPAGDLPNVQIDGYRTASTEGIPVTDGLELSFHTMSLPTARLVWHCAYVDLFWSEDKTLTGPGYKEYGLIRLDGENWEAEEIAQNKLLVNIGDDFKGWDAWKEDNKKGFDCTVTFQREGDRIVTKTENLGVSLKSTTVVLDGQEEIFVSLTGDQCAITNIRVKRP